MHVEPAVIERITRAINFKRPDRVPIWESLQNQSAYDHFAPGMPFPRCAAIACEKLGIDATYGCMQAVVDERTDGDMVHAAQTAWCTAPAFESLDDLRSYDPPKVNERELEEQMLAGHDAIQELYAPHTMYLPQNGGWGFLPGYDSQTFMVLAAALKEDLPALEKFWNLGAERAAARNSITARHRLAPVIQCCEDVACKTGLMVSPDLLREHFFPRFKQVIAPLAEAGIKVIWHSDGNITDVLDDAVEIGIDGINPVDPSAGMHMGAVRRRYGNSLILVGNVGTSHVLSHGTPEEVRADVRRCIRDAGPNGGHLLQSGDGQVMPDTPLENILAYFDEAHRVRRSPAEPSVDRKSE